MHTIGTVQPSEVISRFLGGERILQLATYLTALHDHPSRIAAAEHTTLLFRCLAQVRALLLVL